MSRWHYLDDLFCQYIRIISCNLSISWSLSREYIQLNYGKSWFTPYYILFILICSIWTVKKVLKLCLIFIAVQYSKIKTSLKAEIFISLLKDSVMQLFIQRNLSKIISIQWSVIHWYTVILFALKFAIYFLCFFQWHGDCSWAYKNKQKTSIFSHQLQCRIVPFFVIHISEPKLKNYWGNMRQDTAEK